MRRLNPDTIHPPFANYAHGVEVEAGARIVFCSGQLGIGRGRRHSRRRGSASASLLSRHSAILGEASMSLGDLVRLNAYVASAQYLGGYMKVRDEFVGNPPPASTLMVVQGFARPEFKVEIEAVAARAP